MTSRRLGIIMTGGTGRMGRTQHLARSLIAIRDEGGLLLSNGDRLVPEVILVGRDETRLARTAASFGLERWTTDLDAALSDPGFEVFFDAALTQTRPELLNAALRAGKHIYAEKPVGHTAAQVAALLSAAELHGLRHGVVEDKLHLPGIRRLKLLADSGFFGRITGFKIEFGHWVFDGTHVPCQRSSWNYRSASYGGIVLDLFPHCRYLIENIVGTITHLVSTTWTATPSRVDESGQRYEVDVEDSVHCLVTLENGVHGMIHCGWGTRLRRDDMMAIQVDGSNGSAVAGAHHCYIQPWAQTPKAQWDTDTDLGADYYADWSEVADILEHRNPFRCGWEGFLRHLVEGAPLSHDLRAGLRDVQFAETALASAREKRWMPLEPLGGTAPARL